MIVGNALSAAISFGSLGLAFFKQFHRNGIEVFSGIHLSTYLHVQYDEVAHLWTLHLSKLHVFAVAESVKRVSQENFCQQSVPSHLLCTHQAHDAYIGSEELNWLQVLAHGFGLFGLTGAGLLGCQLILVVLDRVLFDVFEPQFNWSWLPGLAKVANTKLDATFKLQISNNQNKYFFILLSYI